MPSKRQRKWLLILLLGLAAIIFALASLPIWFPWVLRPIASKLHITFTDYSRDGYQWARIKGATFTNENVTVYADTVETRIPTAWAYHRLISSRNERFAEVKGWRVEVTTNHVRKSTSPSLPSLTKIARNTDTVLRALKKLVPAATLTNGTILLPDVRIDVPFATWLAGDLKATGVGLNFPRLNRSLPFAKELTNCTVTGTVGKQPPWNFKIASEPLKFESALTISTNAQGLQAQSSSSVWQSNRISCVVQFGQNGLIPQFASLNAPELHFSLSQLKDYSDLSGSVVGKWTNGSFSLDITGSGNPAPSATNMPSIRADLHASGTTNFLLVHSASVKTPYITANLSRDFKVYFTGELVREPAEADLSLNLSKQPWLPIQGILRGSAKLGPGNKQFPAGEFHITGADFGTKDLKASAVEMNGQFNWPLLSIQEVKASFEDGSKAYCHGNFELEKKEVIGGELTLEGTILQRWMPKGSAYSELRARASVDGPWNLLNHKGHIEVSHVTTPDLKPFDLRADWSGKKTEIVDSSVQILSGDSTLAVDSSVALKLPRVNLRLNKLVFSQTNQLVFALEKPASISLTVPSIPTNRIDAQLDSFEAQGSGGKLHISGGVEWPSSGHVNLAMENVRSGIVNDFIKLSFEPMEIQSLSASGGWTNGPLAFAIDTKGTINAQKDLPLTASVHLSGNPGGITVSNLILSSQTSSVAVARGFLPVSLYPGQPTNYFHLDRTAQFQLEAKTDPQSFAWQKIASWTAMKLTAPNLLINVSGTLEAPRGTVHFQASQIRPPNWPSNAPPFDDIDLAVELDRQTARITECQLLVQSQPIRLSAEIPLGKAFWSRETGLPDWRTGRARLIMNQAQLSAFAPMFPQLLSPQGEMNIELDMQPGPLFDGHLEVSHSRTRPLAALGPIRDISVAVKLHNNRVTLESATGNVGSAAVLARGEADLAKMDWAKLTIPPFRFSLKGTNVPVARQPESIIRADLDLMVTKTNESPALVSGKAHLRNSFFLHDIADLVPARVSTPKRRPPYFSIDVDPISEWRLAVQVTGERFMNVRSTIFNGEVSANLTLQGTLKEPLALGDVRVDSGLIRFPFANLRVQQGFVTLTSKDPYRPQLLVTATSKQYGYDLKMEVTGPADAPILQFTSTPPLSSEQIVLMITAGDLPRDERSLTTQQRAETLALYVGRDLLTRLGFGDEREQRLTFHSGEQLSDQGRPTYNVEYQLTPRWSLVGEYDRFNAFNAGLKWRIYSK